MTGVKKRELLALPVPRAEELPGLTFGANGFACLAFVGGVNILEENSLQLLIVCLYSAPAGLPEYRIFVSRKNEQFAVYDSAGSWREAVLENLLPCTWRNGKTITWRDTLYADEASRYVGGEYFGLISRETLWALSDWQLSLRDFSLRKTTERSFRVIDALMDAVPPPPADIDEWIDGKPLAGSRYAYYTREGKVVFGECTYCGKRFGLPAPSGRIHNSTGQCPLCGTPFTWKNMNIAADFTDSTQYWLGARYADGLVFTRYNVARRYTREKNKTGTHYTQDVTMWNRVFKDFSNRETWYIYETRHLKFGKDAPRWYRDDSDNRTGYDRNEPGAPLYDANLAGALAGTRWERSALDLFARGAFSVRPLSYLNNVARKPAFEQLVKVGLYRLIGEEIESSFFYSAVKNVSATTPRAALGLNAADVRLLAEIDGGRGEAGYLRACADARRPCSKAELRELEWLDVLDDYSEYRVSDDESRYPDFERVVNLIGSVSRAAKYVAEQLERDRSLPRDKRHYHGGATVPHDWRDYLRDCRALGIPLAKGCRAMFPADLAEAHRETSKLVAAAKNADTDKLIANQLPRLERIYGYVGGGYIVRPAASSAELAKEGERMGHCVSRYNVKMAEGRCVIVFIRSADAPDEPLATAEFDGAREIQIRAKNNQVPPQGVMDFWVKYKAEVAARIRAEERAEVQINVETVTVTVALAAG